MQIKALYLKTPLFSNIPIRQVSFIHILFFNIARASIPRDRRAKICRRVIGIVSLCLTSRKLEVQNRYSNTSSIPKMMSHSIWSNLHLFHISHPYDANSDPVFQSRTAFFGTEEVIYNLLYTAHYLLFSKHHAKIKNAAPLPCFRPYALHKCTSTCAENHR